MVHGRHGVQAWLGVGEPRHRFQVLTCLRVRQHRSKCLFVFPLCVVDDALAVGAGVDVGRDEAGLVLDDLLGRGHQQRHQLLLPCRLDGEHVDQSHDRGGHRDRRFWGHGASCGVG